MAHRQCAPHVSVYSEYSSHVYDMNVNNICMYIEYCNIAINDYTQLKCVLEYLVPELGSGRPVCAHGERSRVQDERFRHTCACVSGYHASRLWRTGSATAADTLDPGTVTGWREPARATAGTHRSAFPSRQSPCRPLLQEAMEEGALATPLGPQRPGRVAQSHAGCPSHPGADGYDSASPGRPMARKVIKGGTSWILDVGIVCPGFQRLVSEESRVKQQQSTTPRKRRSTATRRTSCRSSSKQAGASTRPVCTPSQGFCRWKAGLTRRASHGHWRVNGATCLHRLPRRYMRLIVLPRGRGATAYQDMGREVDDDDPTDSERPLPTHTQVCVFLMCAF
jgi:hypothetical protein